MHNPKISIVIAVCNAEMTIVACLDSVMHLDFPKEDLEIIVVDNNSTDTTKEIILNYPVTYLFEPNRGRAWARNKGVKNAKGEYIAFTDADCIVTKDWLKNLLKGIEEDQDIAVGGGTILAYRQENIYEEYAEERGFLNQKKGIHSEDPTDLPRVVTANAIFRRAVIEKVGYFDEDFITSEDTELTWRISLFGYEIRYIPEAIVYHQHRQGLKSFLEQQFVYGRAAVALNRKYSEIYFNIRRNFQIFDVLFGMIATFILLTIRSFGLVLVLKDKKKNIFGFFDAVVNMFYYFGSFYEILCVDLLRMRTISRCKIPFEDFYRNLYFRNNGLKVHLNCKATWFVNDGILRLVVFKDGLHVYQFNHTATRLWQGLLKTGDLKKTTEEVAFHYRISFKDVQNDAKKFISMLEKERIIATNLIQ